MSLAAFGLAAGAATVVGALFVRATKKKRLRLYQRVAARYSQSNIVDGGLWRRNELYLAHAGARFKIWMWDGENDRGTVWEATLPARGTHFRVYREGLSSALGKSLFRTQDIDVGACPAFDQHFVVKGEDPPLVCRTWSRESCELMLRRFARSRIECDGVAIKLTEYRLLKQESEIHDGIALIGALASVDLFGAESLRALDSATFRAGPSPHVVIRGPVNIQIGPVKTASGTVTRATCPAITDLQPPPEKLDAIGARFERDDKQLHILWPGIEESIERLSGAVTLLRELTRAPPEGVFR
jgi:hypothetical protein